MVKPIVRPPGLPALLKLVVIAMSVKRWQNEFQFDHPHPVVYQFLKFVKISAAHSDFSDHLSH